MIRPRLQTLLHCAVALALSATCASGAGPDDPWSVPATGPTAYAKPASNLTTAQLAEYASGQQVFELRWSPRGRGVWGQGPVSNADSCVECHAGKGRTPVHAGDDRLIGMLVRLSLPGEGEHGSPRPHPAYGDQLNDVGMFEVPAEGYASIRYSDRPLPFPDGTPARLRVLEAKFEKLAFGPLGPDTLTSFRAAPALFGMGLFDAVSDQTLRDEAATQAQRGLRGHPNEVWSITARSTVVGRFGLKANRADLFQQVLAAFHGDIGVTSELFPEENCMPVQTDCLEKKPFMKPELTPGIREGVLFFLRAGAAPARRNLDDERVRRGEALFEQAGCADCHLPNLTTSDYPAFPPLSNVTFHPYTDLLLHDMGSGLADGRPDHLASGNEWRTAPLWGIGLAQKVNPGVGYLHDGRARNLVEAILWHGGEAERAREVFRSLPRDDRAALVAFLDAL